MINEDLLRELQSILKDDFHRDLSLPQVESIARDYLAFFAALVEIAHGAEIQAPGPATSSNDHE